MTLYPASNLDYGRDPNTNISASVTAESVEAAGALMDTEVDQDVKTLALPANTTVSAFGATIVDDADAAAVRTTIGAAASADVADTVVLTQTEYNGLTPDAATIYYIVG